MGTKLSERSFCVDDRYHNFVVTRTIDIPEIQSRLVELVHEPTGAQVMHIQNEDEENLFCLSLRTLPESSNGIAHILEHTVLCGSDKFPVKDPFFGMTRRSLNTYMNALTGADFTCYPAASQIPKDFYNLLDVYIDAVFKPHLKYQSFLQEGHRLELADATNPASPLDYKGIVFNEMKGAMASADARLSQAIMEILYPNLTYGVNSGGDPKVIPHLTYEELKAFHQKYYHPSQCLFFFYGNLPLKDHLDFIEMNALKNVKRAPPIPPLPYQPRFKKPVEKDLTYPLPENEDPKEKTLVAFGWLTCHILEQQELLALNVLDVALMGTDASPLKMALLKSELCKQVDSVIDNEISEIPFAIICKGCKEGAAPEILAVITETLKKIILDGIPQNIIDGAIHQIEFYRNEITGDSVPYGLSLFMRSALLKQHGGNPEDGLMIHTLFHTLRENVKDPSYLTGLIEKYFLNNKHFVQIVMHPDQSLAAKELAEEKGSLEKLQTTMKPEEIEKIIKESKELSEYQEQEENQNIEVLPKLLLSDISRVAKEFELLSEPLNQGMLYYHPCFTNHIVYADLYMDLPFVEVEDLPYLRLFAMLLTQLGAGGRDYKENLDYLLEHTGGVGASLDLNLQAINSIETKPSLSLRGKALYRKADKLFPFLSDILTSVDFTDVGRLKELLMQHFNSLENSIHQSSLRYAVNLAASAFSSPGAVTNYWYGLNYFWKIKELMKEFEKSPQFFVEKMQWFQKCCLRSRNIDLVLACDEKMVSQLKKANFYGLEEKMAPASLSFNGWKEQAKPLKVGYQGRLTSSPVAFTAALFPTVSYNHPDTPALAVCSQIMENNVLHKRIREQGGAYGSGAVSGSMSGNFYFYSYRDPHIASTIEAFEEGIHYLTEAEFDDTDMEEAKFGLLQDLDSPCSPGSRAVVSYTRKRSGRSLELRQEFRERLLDLNEIEIEMAANRHLKDRIKGGSLVVFAGKELLEKENKILKEKGLPTLDILAI